MKTVNFVGPDSEELYKKNCIKLGNSWYYYNNPISYTFNSNEYRMDDEISNTNWDNYIYFSGCSYTVGLGVSLENTFPYIVSNNLNCNYVNTAMIGASVELVLNSTITFLSECVKPPKAIIINWPEVARTMWWENNESIGLYTPKQFKGDWSTSYKEFLMHDFHIIKRFEFIRKNLKLICHSMKIPLLEFSTALEFSPATGPTFQDIHLVPSFHDHSVVSSDEKIKNMHWQWARDFGFHGGGHPGWLHHIHAAELITTWINKYV